MGKAIADQVPQRTLVPFEDAGQILFYEQPQKLNAALIVGFNRKLTSVEKSIRLLSAQNFG